MYPSINESYYIVTVYANQTIDKIYGIKNGIFFFRNTP